MKRYYLSKIKTVNMPGMGMVNRHRLQELADELGLNVEYVGGEIAVDPNTGAPTQKALLILIDTSNHVPFANDPQMADFPDASLDTKVSAIGVGARNRARAKITSGVGFSSQETDEAWNGADDLRAVIEHYGRLNNLMFDSRNFDVA